METVKWKVVCLHTCKHGSLQTAQQPTLEYRGVSFFLLIKKLKRPLSYIIKLLRALIVAKLEMMTYLTNVQVMI